MNVHLEPHCAERFVELLGIPRGSGPLLKIHPGIKLPYGHNHCPFALPAMIQECSQLEHFLSCFSVFHCGKPAEWGRGFSNLWYIWTHLPPHLCTYMSFPLLQDHVLVEYRIAKQADKTYPLNLSRLSDQSVWFKLTASLPGALNRRIFLSHEGAVNSRPWLDWAECLMPDANLTSADHNAKNKTELIFHT